MTSQVRRLVAWVILPAALILGAAGATYAADDAGLLPYPEPGTYKLDRIQETPSSLIVDGSGLPHLLSSVTTDKITLLTFFYGHCTDPKGCPLLWEAFGEVREKVKKDPALKDKVRLVFYSFDPKHDIPETLKLFSDLENKDASAAPWHFVTSWSNYFLKPTLESFGQEIAEANGTDDKNAVVINHAVKVFLIDPQGWVREIYTSGFLDPDVIVGDIKTLEIEESGKHVGE